MERMCLTERVLTYLKTTDKSPVPAYFNNSKFMMGYKITTPDYVLTWRIEEDHLVICDLTSPVEADYSKSAVSRFIKLVHSIEDAVPEIKAVRGMIIPSAFPVVNKLRQRLEQVLLGQGARWQVIKEDLWLVYPTKND